MTADAKFKVGDVVELNSGGPPMTVQTANMDGPIVAYSVCWFAEESEPIWRLFLEPMLRRSE